MTTVVTGATGHVGANLVRELLRRGRKVRVVIHENDLGLDGLEVERVTGDVRDRASLDAAFAGADVVYHLAALISITGEQGGLVSAINVEGARNAAEAALARGVRRFIHTCSIHALVQAPLDEPIDETRARVGPSHPAYDRSKAAGEAAVREVVARGLDAVIVHPTAVIGPFDYRPGRLGRVFLDLYHRKLPTLVPGGFDWVDVRDVVAGMLAAEEKGRTNESYLFAGRWRSVADLAAIAAGVTGVAPPRLTTPFWLARFGAPFAELWGKIRDQEPLYTRESLRALDSNTNTSSAKAESELGFSARPFDETVRDIYAWFDQAGMLKPPLSKPD